MEKSLPADEEINFISPIFYDYFKDNIEGFINPANEYLARLKALHGDLRILTFLHYEQELRQLSIALDKYLYPIGDKQLKAVFTLFHCLLYLCLGEKKPMTEYYNLINANDLPTNTNLFHKIYLLIGEYIRKAQSPIKLKMKVIVSRAFDDLSFHLLNDNVYKTKSRYSYLIETSQQNKDLHETFSSNPNLFICGHGSDDSQDGGLKYHYDLDNYLRIKGDFVSLYHEKFNVLALLSCGTMPYLDHKNGFKYFILSERTSSPQLSEMFVKTFNLTYNNTKDMELSLKLGMVSLFFHTDEKLAFSIYKKGDLLKL